MRKDLEAQITARTDAAVDVAKTGARIADLEAALEAARGEYGDKITTALDLMSATDLAGLVGVKASALRAAAKHRTAGRPSSNDNAEQGAQDASATPAEG